MKALSSALAVGDKYFIVENSTTIVDIYGMFASGSTVTDNSGDTFVINYTDNGDLGLLANDISLTVATIVPEPSTWVAATLALLAIAFTQRRKMMAALTKLSLQV